MNVYENQQLIVQKYDISDKGCGMLECWKLLYLVKYTIKSINLSKVH